MDEFGALRRSKLTPEEDNTKLLGSDLEKVTTRWVYSILKYLII